MKKNQFFQINSQHIDKLNRITKDVLLSVRFIKNRNYKNNNLLIGINEKNNSNFYKVNPNVKKKINLLNEFSFNSRPLSSNQSNIYNRKLNQSEKKSNRLFSYENNKTPNNILRKKSSLDMKKEEMMNLLYNNYKSKSKTKGYNNLIRLNRKNINISIDDKLKVSFIDRMKTEINKMLFKNNNQNNNINKKYIDNEKIYDLIFNTKNHYKSKKEIIHKRNQTFKNLLNPKSNDNQTFELITKLKRKYELNF